MDQYTQAYGSDIERTYVPPKQFMQSFTLWSAVLSLFQYFIVQIGKKFTGITYLL